MTELEKQQIRFMFRLARILWETGPSGTTTQDNLAEYMDDLADRYPEAVDSDWRPA